MTKGYTYILKCSDGSYYTGSTIDLELRLQQHQSGNGTNHTKKRLPIKLVYFEEFQRIDDALYREKQIQGWSRLKKEALIKKHFETLPELSLSYRDKVSSRASDTTRISNTTEVPGSKKFYSHGKLLITAEYVVLDGAEALALPTKFGQSLTIEPIDEPKLIWKSSNANGEVWFEDEFILNNKILNQVQDDNDLSKRLLDILNTSKKLNPHFLNTDKGYRVNSKLEFPQNWGLGSSSTLINNIASWANVNSFELLEKTFGGSGYDIACAQNDTAITYQLENETPLIKVLDFNPSFKEHLYFVHLNKKQDSREGIALYKANKHNINASILEINTITQKMIHCKTLSEFKILIEQHEIIISKIIQLEPIKKKLFNDFNGAIKSLGAWGGDFILTASQTNPEAYFKSKGYHTIISFNEMILN